MISSPARARRLPDTVRRGRLPGRPGAGAGRQHGARLLHTAHPQVLRGLPVSAAPIAPLPLPAGSACWAALVQCCTGSHKEVLSHWAWGGETLVSVSHRGISAPHCWRWQWRKTISDGRPRRALQGRGAGGGASRVKRVPGGPRRVSHHGDAAGVSGPAPHHHRAGALSPPRSRPLAQPQLSAMYLIITSSARI